MHIMLHELFNVKFNIMYNMIYNVTSYDGLNYNSFKQNKQYMRFLRWISLIMKY